MVFFAPAASLELASLAAVMVDVILALLLWSVKCLHVFLQTRALIISVIQETIPVRKPRPVCYVLPTQMPQPPARSSRATATQDILAQTAEHALRARVVKVSRKAVLLFAVIAPPGGLQTSQP